MDGSTAGRPGPATADEAIGALAPAPVHRAWRLVIGHDRRRGYRLMQWATGGFIYAGAAMLMATGIAGGWMRAGHLAGWGVFVAAGTAIAYVLLRSGWSERFADPALTQWQIAMGIVAVNWGYMICGPFRTLALFPLLLIFSFGAFALRWRQIAFLTVFALVSLAAAVWWQLAYAPPWRDDPPLADLPVDLINFAVILLLLPALAIVAARLSALRSALQARRVELTQALAEVRRLATTDELTGLPNRRRMIDRLAESKRRADAGEGGFCLAVIDLDEFKQVNDRLGHAQGDAVLRQFADRAVPVLASGQLLARWGGEEFLLLMPDLSLDAACNLVEALLARIRGLDCIDAPLTFSAGVAVYRDDADVLSTVLRADRAMYAAKQGGRNAVLPEAAGATPVRAG
jgi:diguanylate cyclase (GGDEF)-like protein